MKSFDYLLVIFIFGVGVSFIVARGLWEARDYRLAQLRATRSKRHTAKKVNE